MDARRLFAPSEKLVWRMVDGTPKPFGREFCSLQASFKFPFGELRRMVTTYSGAAGRGVPVGRGLASTFSTARAATTTRAKRATNRAIFYDWKKIKFLLSK
ncbi:hypothetical protein TYRP_018018 [Tyrophagus putrescentiae]|nr:hypothetical protein TYRP_018018 [Tyrophagus putrescentiae]